MELGVGDNVKMGSHWKDTGIRICEDAFLSSVNIGLGHNVYGSYNFSASVTVLSLRTFIVCTMLTFLPKYMLVAHVQRMSWWLLLMQLESATSWLFVVSLYILGFFVLCGFSCVQCLNIIPDFCSSTWTDEEITEWKAQRGTHCRINVHVYATQVEL